MPKGYCVGHIPITDLDVYREYVAANQAAFKKYDARFIVRGGKVFANFPGAKHEVVNGEMRDRRSLATNLPGYQAAAKVRERSAVVDLMAIEGFEPTA
jgi:uncharacterized protein (DUF1330 family)